MKKERLFLLALPVVLGLFLVWEIGLLLGRPVRPGGERDFNLLQSVMKLIKANYLEEKNPVETMDGALKGLVNSLDPGSCYLDKKTTSRYLEVQKAEARDIGAVVYKAHGLFPQVLAIMDDSPAAKSGLKAGDTITEIEGKSTVLMSLAEVSTYLKDTARTPVKLKYIREDDTLEVTVERTFRLAEAASFTPNKGTAGILSIRTLRPASAAEIKKNLLPKIKAQNATAALIVDLRNSAEGTVDEARRVINLFLKADQAGFFERKGGAKEPLACPESPELDKLPLVVWTNQATLGPAEIVAAVLKEFRQAKIVGFQTAGLAAKQEFLLLQDGSSLVLSSAVFSVKPGLSVWNKGVTPDVKLEIRDPDTALYLQKTLGLLATR